MYHSVSLYQGLTSDFRKTNWGDCPEDSHKVCGLVKMCAKFMLLSSHTHAYTWVCVEIIFFSFFFF